jgi:hypothetical protein
MPHWRSWQEICVEVSQLWEIVCSGLIIRKLLSGDRAYEPNPAIEHAPGLSICPFYRTPNKTRSVADPFQHRRLEYLRPILGHIHSGGLRFKDRIESAFKRQALMLTEARTRLERSELGTMPQGNSRQPDEKLLRALWPRSRELHYVAHFREPLDVKTGDIGYITGKPELRFVRLANVYREISDNHYFTDGTIPLRREPVDRWTREVVEGAVR